MPRPAPDDPLATRVGWGLFGVAARLRLGIWIAQLPGHAEPRTFTLDEYAQYSRDRNIAEHTMHVRAHLARFVELEMLQPRPELSNKRYNQHWTRLDSPLWDIFLVAGVATKEYALVLDHRRRRTVNDLSRLREELRRGRLDDQCICPEACDCQRPPTHLSNLCPSHNDVPMPDEDCPAYEHRNGAPWNGLMSSSR